MAFIEHPLIMKKKIPIKTRFIEINKSLTKWCGMAGINKFIYLTIQKVALAAKYVRGLEGYYEARNQIINTTLMGLLVGFAIFSWKTGNSFLRGISIAITLVITENYLKWLKDLFKTEKRK
jgi:hypothetical protein